MVTAWMPRMSEKIMKSLKGIKSLTVSMLFGLSIIPGLSLASNTFVFDPQVHRWYAYENGELIRSGIASGGRGFCSDSHHRCHTPVGVYSVLRKGGSDCKSTIYPMPHGGAPMPYCMFFSKFYAIHGSNELSATSNISHGCIRIQPEAARWLNEEFLNVGSRVVVKPY
jgi:lipoprotein-anchoring transpeptidase ErfK/SrfK